MKLKLSLLIVVITCFGFASFAQTSPAKKSKPVKPSTQVLKEKIPPPPLPPPPPPPLPEKKAK